MKAKLQARLKSKKGFTLVELLVVVAIIAILVAISIPMVTGALTEARTQTDAANMRAAEGAAMIQYLLEDGGESSKIYTYDANSGLVKDAASFEAASSDVKTGYNQATQSTDIQPGNGVVNVKITSADGIESKWVRVTTTPGG